MVTTVSFDDFIWGEFRERVQDEILDTANSIAFVFDPITHPEEFRKELEDEWQFAIEDVLDNKICKPMWKEFDGAFEDWARLTTEKVIEETAEEIKKVYDA